jgi:2-C-methyl-D-erythritol 4-phosphate cytidylyltransferase
MRGRDKVGAIIVAAGQSSRMGGVDKIFAPLCGKPLLAQLVEAFQDCPSVDEVVVILGKGNLERGQRLVAEYGWSKVIAVCQGGLRRQDSVREGIKRLSDCQWVVIHDGARPLISTNIIETGLDEAQSSGVAVAAVPVKDTIKLVSGDGFVRQTPNRHDLWAVQTPQVFRFHLLAEAHRQAAGEVTDDAMLVEQLGHKVKVYMGSYENIKVTTPEDLALAEFILRKRNTAP